jgi:hypothetical protein
MDEVVFLQQCPECGGLRDCDEEFACGFHHEGPYNDVSYTVEQIRSNNSLLQLVSTKNPSRFSQRQQIEKATYC